MGDLQSLPVRNNCGDVCVVIETPRGSAAKLEFDLDLQAFTLSKPLMLGLSYPHDWGFIPSTKGEDGDPIDVLALHDVATSPGLVLKCKGHALAFPFDGGPAKLDFKLSRYCRRNSLSTRRRILEQAAIVTG